MKCDNFSLNPYCIGYKTQLHSFDNAERSFNTEYDDRVYVITSAQKLNGVDRKSFKKLISLEK